jgi:hypothetical protein
MSDRNINTPEPTLIRLGPGDYVTEDGRYHLSREAFLWECEGRHPGCPGIETHAYRRWVVYPSTRSFDPYDWDPYSERAHRTMAGAVAELARILAEGRAR